MSLTSLEPSQILVYLGPTLSVTQASAILPACYLAPVRCGDILACLRLQPRAIVIIDGFFDCSAAVWHKEILWALAAGVRVLGSSSMGALRAAELEVFGMEGFGSIFAAYRQGQYIGDDEVAIVHSNAEANFQPLTDALVNIRATVAHAVTKNILDPELADLIVNCAQKQFFSHRYLKQAIADALEQGGDHHTLKQFGEFVQTGGYVDRKQLDAIELLKHLATSIGEKYDKPTQHQQLFKLNKSIFIEELQARVAIRPLSTAYSWLPLAEKLCQEARLFGRVYIQLRNLAGLIRWCNAIAQQQNLQSSLTDTDEIDRTGIWNKSVNLEELDLDDVTMPAFRERIGRIQALYQVYARQDDFGEKVEKLHQFILTIVGKEEPDGLYLTTSADFVNCEHRLYRQVAILWALAEQTNSQSEHSLRPSIIQKVTHNFCQEQGINNDLQLQDWLSKKSLTLVEFSDMMEAVTMLEGFVNVPRWWNRGMTNYFSVADHFLPDALRLSGFYPILKQRLQSAQISSEEWQGEVAKWYRVHSFPLEYNINQVAFWLDFSDPESFVKEQRRI